MPHSETRPGRILVVDEQSASLRDVCDLLERNGYAVVTAGDSHEALGAARSIAPDLILLDMSMPGMDGFALLSSLRREPRLGKVPVIFLAATQDRGLLLRAFEAGAVDYVTKPYMPEELLARVGAHIGLKLTRDRLERVARERQDLVTLVAHDLKNPLATVLFASQMLQQPDCRPERVPRYVEVIHESASDAFAYIQRYLEQQAHRGAQADTPADAAADLGDVLAWLSSRYALQLEAAGMRLHCTSPAGSGRVAIDPLMLRQVAENLVSNALKYARDGGVLELHARRGAPGYWQLLAEDRGGGIPESRQRQLFKPFQYLAATAATGSDSNGLGLALAKQVITNAGGQLWYEDREGGGARFVIELPEAAPRDA